uniref:Uncharacterized protein n=1 Tax=Anguilla anguilla TaxID=7936 RepID=A0A0E9PK62_ANGAN
MAGRDILSCHLYCALSSSPRRVFLFIWFQLYLINQCSEFGKIFISDLGGTWGRKVERGPLSPPLPNCNEHTACSILPVSYFCGRPNSMARL